MFAYLQWATSGVYVRGKFYPLARLYFANRRPDEVSSEGSEEHAEGSTFNAGTRDGTPDFRH